MTFDLSTASLFVGPMFHVLSVVLVVDMIFSWWRAEQGLVSATERRTSRDNEILMRELHALGDKIDNLVSAMISSTKLCGCRGNDGIFRNFVFCPDQVFAHNKFRVVCVHHNLYIGGYGDKTLEYDCTGAAVANWDTSPNVNTITNANICSRRRVENHAEIVNALEHVQQDPYNTDHCDELRMYRVDQCAA